MSDRRPRFDPNERFGLLPMEGQEVLERLLGTERAGHDPDDEDESSEDEDF